MYIYFCEKCQEFEAFKSNNGDFKCPNCGCEYLALGVTVDEWNGFSNDEMLDTIDRAKDKKKPVIKKTTEKKTKPETAYSDGEAEADKVIEQVKTNNNQVSCPKCKTSISKEEKKCPNCGNQLKKTRVYEIAKELNIKSILAVAVLEEIGIEERLQHQGLMMIRSKPYE